jgi:hypothetical protein
MKKNAAILTRRGLLTGLIAAPLVVPAGRLMRLRGVIMPAPPLQLDVWNWYAERLMSIDPRWRTILNDYRCHGLAPVSSPALFDLFVHRIVPMHSENVHASLCDIVPTPLQPPAQLARVDLDLLDDQHRPTPLD